MIIDTAGTYTLKYTAEDACGNVTEVEREVEAVQITYRTVLYTDGTFIINEKSTDQAANEALHGAATNVYDPFDPNGATNKKKYIFVNDNDRYWNNERSSILKVEIGSPISPTSMHSWFSYFTKCTTFNFTNLDTSKVTDMARLFNSCYVLTALDLSLFDTSNVTDMQLMFNSSWRLETLDLSSFNTSKVTNMKGMFADCYVLTALDLSLFDTSNVTDMGSMFKTCETLQTLDLSNFNTAKVVSMAEMFSGCQELTSVNISSFNTSLVRSMRRMFISCRKLTTLDISTFDTSSVNEMSNMFEYCVAMKTIYASVAFVTTQLTDSTSSDMFRDMSTNLVGGAGTRWASSNPVNKTYAHIDGGTANPGYFTLKSA